MSNDSTPFPPTASTLRSRRRRILILGSRRSLVHTGRALRAELIVGIIIITAAVLGVAAANSPWAEQYFALRDTRFGPEVLGLNLNLTLGAWASDGLLAIFFFMVGLELKRDFVQGALSRFSTAIVPVAAAFGGVAVPALIYAAFNIGAATAHGWAIPTATDIAFAVAVLGLLAPGIPTSLRVFLLTLAVVDDLIAISIIAVFYTEQLNFVALGLSILPMAAFFFVARKFAPQLVRSHWLPWVTLLPLGIITWALFHESGIHATIAGVLLAFLMPVTAKGGTELAKNFEHRYQPLSSGVAIPVFAFFASGVALGEVQDFPFSPVALGIMVGLVLGKPIGITLTTWLITKFTRASLESSVNWFQLIGVASLAGVGFTVSLLITDLSFGDPGDADTARLAVMVGSVTAIAVASCFLVRRRKRPNTQLLTAE